MEKSAATDQCRETLRLSAGLAAGDEEAFREFHAAYFDRLLRYVIVVTHGDEEAAREVLQETLTRIVRHARRFDTAEAFWAWLTVLARSAAIDRGRKQQRYWRLLRSYALSWLPAPTMPVAGEETEDHLHALLTNGIQQLDPADRAFIEGKYLRGESVRELAQESGLTEKAVEARLARARQQLRKQMLKRLKHEEAN